MLVQAEVRGNPDGGLKLARQAWMEALTRKASMVLNVNGLEQIRAFARDIYMSVIGGPISW